MLLLSTGSHCAVTLARHTVIVECLRHRLKLHLREMLLKLLLGVVLRRRGRAKWVWKQRSSGTYVGEELGRKGVQSLLCLLQQNRSNLCLLCVWMQHPFFCVNSMSFDFLEFI